jgi:PAS domain S-box-containing protein
MDLSRASPHLTPDVDRLIERLMAAGRHDTPEAALRAAVARAESRVASVGAETGNGLGAGRLATILDGIGDGFYALDPDWRFTVINRAAERYFGRPRETMLGRVIWEVFPWSQGTELRSRYERAMAERRSASFETRSVGVPDRQVEFHLFPYDGGLGVGFRDWTDRHDTEQALRDREKQLRLALDAGRLAIFEYDIATRRLKPSPELNDVLGYPRDHVLDVDEVRARYYPGDHQRVQEAGRAAIAAGQRFFQIEFRLRRPDGVYRWFLLRAEPLSGASGGIETVVGVLLDIDERRQTEIALQESEARLAIATAAADLGIWDWNLVSNAFIYSDRARAIFGFLPDQAITLDDVRGATHPDDIERTQKQARRALDPAIRGKAPYEYRIVRADGEIRWVVAHGEAVFGVVDGVEKALRYVGTIQDITAHKRASEDLRESEARLLALADNLPLGMVYQIGAPKGRPRHFIYVSGNCERVNGVPAEAAIADPNVLYNLVLPEFRAGMDAAAARTLEEQRPYDIELAARHAATGETRWYRVIAAPRILPSGEPVWDGIQIDITDQKWAEEAVRRSEERLRTILDEMPVGVMLARMPTGEMVFSNAKSAELLGHPVHEIERISDFAMFGAIHPDGTPYRPDEYPVVRTVQHGMDIDQEEMLYRRGDGRIAHLAVSSTPVFSNPDREGFAVCAFYDVTERKRAEEHQSLLINELNHRVKNTLATVQSIAAQSFREAEASTEAGRVAVTRAAFEARLFALARAHDVLTQANWESAGLRDIIDQAVAPYRGGVDYHVFITEGPNLRVTPQMALSLSMALHELCTNAVKYGALSRSGGHVRVTWTETIADERRLRLVWQERDGPPVSPPTRRGFGTRLIERGVARELGGHVTVAYDPPGLSCTVDVPLRHQPL